jgi:hypothetical protein
MRGRYLNGKKEWQVKGRQERKRKVNNNNNNNNNCESSGYGTHYRVLQQKN